MLIVACIRLEVTLPSFQIIVDRLHVSTYHSQNLDFERVGVSIDWRNTGIISGENLPNNFFFLTEVHYGGSGCYTTSDRWVEAKGTAIGLR